jgi:hypothetical protein
MIAAQRPDYSFSKTVNTMANLLHKFCSPRINIDGSIALGESRLCPKVAKVTDSDSDIIKKIHEFKCNGCQISIDILQSSNSISAGLFNIINE